MRVLYLYRSERLDIWRGALSGEFPDTPLYGLRHMSDFDVVAEFFDEDRRMDFATRLLQTIAGIVIRSTAIGWNLNQALRTLPRLRHYNCIFATTDSTGLPLAFLKRLGFWKGTLVIASQGLTQCLATKGWNWGFHLHRWSLKAADCFVTYGWAERQELIDCFSVNPGKVEWIPFGVDSDYYSRWDVNHKALSEDVVLSVGRDQCRDFHTLLDAARQLPHILFRIITTPENLAGLVLPSNVDVRYDLSIREVVRQYAACRFVVLPVRDSSYSFATTVAFEAMATGKAVVLSRTRAVGPVGSGYDLSDGVHCHFVPPGDVPSLVRAISELWLNPDACRDLGMRAREHALRVFGSRHLAGHLSRIFRTVADPQQSKSTWAGNPHRRSAASQGPAG